LCGPGKQPKAIEGHRIWVFEDQGNRVMAVS
jgi:hypothetical protein